MGIDIGGKYAVANLVIYITSFLSYQFPVHGQGLPGNLVNFERVEVHRIDLAAIGLIGTVKYHEVFVKGLVVEIEAGIASFFSNQPHNPVPGVFVNPLVRHFLSACFHNRLSKDYER